MRFTVPKLSKKDRYWFYLRKGFFQVFMPIILGIITLWDYGESKNKSSAYDHLYFYTALILFIHQSIKKFLDFLFSYCADNVIFKKKFNLEKTSELLLTETTENHPMIVIRKVFKLRYSDSPIIEKITQLCWYAGIDCPVFIPKDVVDKLKINTNTNNEDELLHNTIQSLYDYQPQLYNVIPVVDLRDSAGEEIMDDTPDDAQVTDMQNALFNKNTDPIIDV